MYLAHQKIKGYYLVNNKYQELIRELLKVSLMAINFDYKLKSIIKLVYQIKPIYYQSNYLYLKICQIFLMNLIIILNQNYQETFIYY